MRLYGKDNLKRRLNGIAAKGRLPHAVLFSGNEGCGRRTMAKYTAQLFLCDEHRACGECIACRNIESGNHPDVVYVMPILEEKSKNGKSRIENFRDIFAESMILPISGDIRVYLVEDCDTLSTEILNTLLKTIEEPPDHLRFVFTCQNTALIPITVMSRVTEFEVPDMDAESCAECLVETGADPKQAKELALTFSGNITKCKAVLNGDSAVQKLIEAARTAAAAIGRRDGFGLTAALAGQTGRAEFSQVTDLLADIIRDSLAIKQGQRSELFCKKEAEKIAAQFSEEEIVNMLDVLFELEKNEIYNLNLALSGVYFTSRILG